MAAPMLRFGSIVVERDRLNEHARRVPLDTPQPLLRLFTQGGAAREVPMTRAQLTRMIAEAAAALAALNGDDR